MKKTLLKILGIISLITIPVIALATIAVPWNATSLTAGIIQPTTVNGTNQAINVASAATSTFAGPISTQGYIVGTTTTVCTWPETCTYQVIPGSTHAGVKIQAALDALKTMGGGTVMIKKGTYNTNESNNNIVMATSTCIAGEGDATNLVVTTAGVGILFPEISGACMHDLKITDGSSLSSPSITGYALTQIRNSSNIKINNVTVANANGFAFYIVSTGSASTTGVTLINNNLQCNGHQDCIGGGPTVQTLSTTSDITILGNTITQTLLSGGTLNSNMDANCIDIVQALNVNFSYNNCKGRVVLGNEKYPNSQDTINGNIIDAALGLTKVSGQISVYEAGTIAGQQVNIQGNILKNGTIYLNGISGTPLQNANVAGNTIISSQSTYQNDSNDGIRFDYVSNSRIEDNIMVAGDTTKTGISVTNSTNVTAVNNHIKDFSVGVNLNAGSGNKSIFNDFNNVATPGTDIATISMNSASVGIGTNAAGTKLDVNGLANTGFTNNPKILRLQTTDAFATNMGGGIGFGGVYTGTSQADFAYIGGLKENSTDGNYAGRLVFGTRTNGSGATDMTRMVIDSTGNVGIGTTTPGSLLSIGNTGGININPTATSSFGSSAAGINITKGCFAIAGVCISGGGGGGSGTVSSGLAGQLGYYNSSGTVIQSTSTNPLYVTALAATSSAATSTFLGNVYMGDGTNLGFVTGTQPFEISGTSNLPYQMIVSNKSTGGNAMSAYTLVNNNYTNTANPFADTYYSGLYLAGPYFNTYPGLLPNDLVMVNSDGNIHIAALSTNTASSTIGLSMGPGFTSANYDVVFNQTSTGPRQGIATTSPYATLSVVGNVVAANFIATSTATSTVISSLSLGGYQSTAEDNLLSINGTRTYTNSGTTQSAAGMVNINNGSNSREAVEIFQPSTDTVSAPSLFRIENQNTSASNQMLFIKSNSSQFANTDIWMQSVVAPAIAFQETPWAGGIAGGAGQFQISDHNNTMRFESRNNANSGFTADAILSPQYSTTTSGRITFFPDTSYTEGTGRFNIFGTSTISNLLNLTSIQGATEGDRFVVKQAGNVGVGTSSPASKLTVKISAVGDGLVVDGSASPQADPQTSLSVDGVQKFAFGVALGVADFSLPAAVGDVVVRATNGTGSLILTNQNNAGIKFASGTANNTDTVKMTMTAGGLFGEGTTTPVYALTSFSSTLPQVALSAGAGISQWAMRNAGGNLYIATTTIVGTATSTQTALTLDVNGILSLGNYANCNGTSNALGITSGQVLCDSLVSDQRLKKDIQPLSDGLATILALKPVTFNWKDLTNHNTSDPREQYGFIAQDVQKVLPSAVGESPDGYLTLDKTAIIPYLVSAVQEISTGKITVEAKRNVEENWQWIVIGMLILWNTYLTFRKK